MRLDRYLSKLGLVPRRQIKKLLKQENIRINGTPVIKTSHEVSEGDILTLFEEEIEVKLNVTVLIHKPAGYICSNVDEGKYPSRKDLIIDCPYAEMVEIAGRLDVDTEGLLIASSDGSFIHNIIHPKHNKEKEYLVVCELPFLEDDIDTLKKGIKLDTGYITKPAKAEKIDEKTILLTITEGKYHQVKKMIEALNNSVQYLKRNRIDIRSLDNLKKGEWTYSQ